MRALLPVDGSDASERAVQCAIAWGGRRPRAVDWTVLTVRRPLVRAWPGPEPAWDAISREMHAQGRAILAGPLDALAHAGCAAQARVAIGSPASTILDVARDDGASVVVMGTRGSGMVGGFALGSVALGVAPAAPCPVILVKPDARLPDGTRPTTRVLAAVDGSAVSSAVVARLLALRDLLGPVQVDLVHFQPALPLIETIAPPHDDVLHAWSGEQGIRALEHAQALLRDAGVPHAALRLTGDAVPGVAALAGERGADLIAMATHGTGALHHATVGSVALRTAVLAAVPVLLSH